MTRLGCDGSIQFKGLDFRRVFNKPPGCISLHLRDNMMEVCKRPETKQRLNANSCLSCPIKLFLNHSVLLPTGRRLLGQHKNYIAPSRIWTKQPTWFNEDETLRSHLPSRSQGLNLFPPRLLTEIHWVTPWSLDVELWEPWAGSYVSRPARLQYQDGTEDFRRVRQQ